jgi:hypothetical protein
MEAPIGQLHVEKFLDGFRGLVTRAPNELGEAHAFALGSGNVTSDIGMKGADVRERGVVGRLEVFAPSHYFRRAVRV